MFPPGRGGDIDVCRTGLQTGNCGWNVATRTRRFTPGRSCTVRRSGKVGRSGEGVWTQETEAIGLWRTPSRKPLFCPLPAVDRTNTPEPQNDVQPPSVGRRQGGGHRFHCFVALTLPVRTGQDWTGLAVYVPLRPDDVKVPPNENVQFVVQLTESAVVTQPESFAV